MAKNYCDDCVYCGNFNGNSGRYCRYILMTNQRRPCPPGEGCTAKVGMEVKRRKRKDKGNG